jgi:hypothetical protein
VSIFKSIWRDITDRGFFALGMAVGTLFTILVFVAIGRMPDWLQQTLSREERIAEWLMVVFTIFAFFILLSTLKTTREVGNAQVSAYLSLNVNEVRMEREGSDVLISIDARIENSGNSPAYAVRVGYNITQPLQGDMMELIYDIDKIGFVGVPHPMIPQKSKFHGTTLKRKMKYVPNSQVRFAYMIEFKNVFGELKTTPVFSGLLLEYPADSGRFVLAADNISTGRPF